VRKEMEDEDEILSFSSRLLSIIILKDYFYESIVCIYQTHSTIFSLASNFQCPQGGVVVVVSIPYN
jgi:hypothetical protein